jgi:hypothetical protein
MRRLQKLPSLVLQNRRQGTKFDRPWNFLAGR